MHVSLHGRLLDGLESSLASFSKQRSGRAANRRAPARSTTPFFEESNYVILSR